jgi:hypothetical protein
MGRMWQMQKQLLRNLINATRMLSGSVTKSATELNTTVTHFLNKNPMYGQFHPKLHDYVLLIFNEK